MEQVLHNTKETLMIKEKKIGLVVGRFLPLHLGHLDIINKAHAKLGSKDELNIIILDIDKQNSFVGSREITAKQRARWLVRLYGEFDNIKVHILDKEDNLKHIIPKVDVVFHSEKVYKNDYLKDVKHICIKKDIEISSCKIRENLFGYWDYLPVDIRGFFVKKVLFLGTESCGKSTLVKKLANVLNTSYTQEYGKVFVQKRLNNKEDLLKSSDYEHFVLEQLRLEKKAIRKANKVVLLDTDALVTAFYLKLYEDKNSQMIDEVVKNNYYDLAILLEPSVEWVDDGLRSLKTQQNREKAHEKLHEFVMKNFKNYKKLYIVKDGSYEKRLELVTSYINELLK